MADGLQALLIEDNPGDARLVEELLKETGEAISVDWVDSLDDGVQKMLKGDYDVVLLDLGLPDSDKKDSVSTVHLFDTDTPIVVLSGDTDEEAALQAVRDGAQDYLVKGTYEGKELMRIIRVAIARCQQS
ncbi:MAG: response regulator [Thermoplasmatota archaeon]